MSIQSTRSTFSRDMHSETELPGNPFPLETHAVIQTRYFLAGELATGKDLLEVGCGSGIGISYLANKAKTYTGGEHSEENLEFIQRTHGSQFHVEKVDAHDMPFDDNSFDVVVALAMVYYLDLKVFLKEVSRVLRPGGTLFFCTSNHDVPGFVPAPFTTGYYSVPVLKSLLAGEGWRAEFQGAFPAPGGSLFRRNIRALAKNTIKAIVTCLPGGGAYWRRLRTNSLGGLVPLPTDLKQMDFDLDSTVFSISSNAIESSYRIIYVTCRRKK
ncbi:hypothetical protein BVY04_01000 [bacterium M21]|nr:hypothetical protein BVY04_01000 [bacterium M21]